MEMTEIIRELSETSALAKHNELQIQEMKEKITNIQEENRAIHDIATSVKLIAQDVNYIKTDVSTVKTSQNDLRKELSEVKQSSTKAKAKWLDKAIGAIIGAVGAGVLAFLLNTLCPSIFS